MPCFTEYPVCHIRESTVPPSIVILVSNFNAIHDFGDNASLGLVSGGFKLQCQNNIKKLARSSVRSWPLPFRHIF